MEGVRGKKKRGSSVRKGKGGEKNCFLLTKITTDPKAAVDNGFKY